MASLIRRFASPVRAWKPLTFSNSEFPKIDPRHDVEEEALPHYVASDYYPALIGQVLRDRYQLVGKLGYGRSSTVWLARDMENRRHVSLKINLHSKAMGDLAGHELALHRRVSRASGEHPGREVIRGLLDSFDVAGPDGSHSCLVHPPLWQDLQIYFWRSPQMRLTTSMVAVLLYRLFRALDFLHTNCQIIHTDIKPRNIMLGIREDDPVLTKFVEEEQLEPSPRKTRKWNGRRIYLSRQIEEPESIELPVLCDFCTAQVGYRKHLGTAQPDPYRAPEVIIQAPWSYEIDIWNVGCMIWDLYQGRELFTGRDPGQADHISDHDAYRCRAHLAEIIALLGPPPQSLIQLGARSHEFFTDAGDFRGDISDLDQSPLEDRVFGLEGENREKFVAMMRKMLQWDPSKRATARELAKDEWIMDNLHSKD